MNFELFIAKKHLTHRRKTGFISLISMISVGGVAVGVMALIVVLAVMSGFDRELKSKIVNVQPHLRIEKINGIDSVETEIKKIQSFGIPGVQTLAPFAEGQAILRSDTSATGVMIKGFDPAREDLSIFKNHLSDGDLNVADETFKTTQRRFLFFKKTISSSRGGILIGEVLAAKLSISVGDTVQLISPFQEAGAKFFLGSAPSRPFVVRGIFRLGMNDFDSVLALIPLSHAQAVYHLGSRVTGLSLRFREVNHAEKWKYILRGEYTDDYLIQSWYDMNHNFFQALKVEKSVMTILLALIILVAAFNIVSTLTMVVMEKTRDIGILRALGATRAGIRRIFIVEGTTVGLFGVIGGVIAGLLAAFNLNAISDFLKHTTGLEVFPSDIYYFDKIPAEIHGADIVMIVIFAVLASMVAGFYPAHRAASLHPLEALRYE